MNKIKTILVFLITDLAWIIFNKNTYNNLVYNIQNSFIEINIKKIISLIITYFFLIYGLIKIVIPYEIPFGFGGVVYGVYSFTNYTLFKNYPFWLAVVDTLWGMFLYKFTLFISKLYNNE